MNFSDLRPGTKCFLKVVPEKCKLKEIVVATDDGYEFSVRKLAFQRNSELPDTLACYIKESYDGILWCSRTLCILFPRNMKRAGHILSR